MNSRAATSSEVLSPLLCLCNLFLNSTSVFALPIGLTAIILHCSTSFSAALSLRAVIRIDLFWHCGIYSTSDREFPLPAQFVWPSWPALWSSTRKLVLSTLFSIRTYPFLSSHSQSCTSWKILAVGFCRLEILTQSVISQKLCSNQAALLAWTQKTYVSGDRSWVQYVYSIVSCDFLRNSQLSALAKAFVLTPRRLSQRARFGTLRQHISGESDQISLARQSLCYDWRV